MADSTKYAFTLRKTKLVDLHEPKLLRIHYGEHLTLFEQLGCTIIDHEYEEKGGLHVHGIINIPRDFFIKRLRYRGWNLDVKVIYDEVGWLSYIRKEKLKRMVEVVPIKNVRFNQ